VWAGRNEEPGPVPVHLVGDLPPVADWGFAALLGRDAEVTRHGREADDLASVVRTLEDGSGGPALVVVAALGHNPAGRTGPKPSAVGAVAFLLDPAEEPSPFPFVKASTPRSPLAAAYRAGEPGRELPRGVTLVGDWDRVTDGDDGARRKTSRRPAEPDVSVVSEGAYVPRARYLENLPSRWRFVAELCGACHGTTFPARGVCRKCGRSDLLSELALPLDGGRVVAVTTVGKGGQPTEFDAQVEATGPYDVALVELARGMRVTLQVTDAPAGALAVGDHVNTRLRRLYPMEGEWRYGRKAVPLPGARSRTTARDP